MSAKAPSDAKSGLGERPGEFDMIARYFTPLAAKAPGAYGLKDDAAVWQPTPGHEIVLTVDTLVEGIHFFAHDAADLIARKLLRVNLSDLAAKGARPRGYLLSIAMPDWIDAAWLALFAKGLEEDQALFDLNLWGGDSVATRGPLTLTLTAIGETPTGNTLRRGGGQAGDAIYVTGSIGDAALGLLVANDELKDLSPAARSYLHQRYLLPQPRLALGQGLCGIAHAALDVSDGLIADLTHLCTVSGTGARITASAVPLSPAATEALALNPALLETVLSGGDDYEIVFCAPQSKEPDLMALANACGVAVTCIGLLLPQEQAVQVVDALGHPITLRRTGYTHF